MKIDLREIPVRDLVEDYKDSAEEGVRALGGALDVRPPYQREFVYKDKQRNAVIESIRSGFPLNVFYWTVTPDGTYECLDGQQRTISICQYLNHGFSLPSRDGSKMPQYHDNLTKAELDEILNYKLMVYVCEGTEREILDWFRVINIAGEPLTEQELRNAVYVGPWLASAKAFFSKTGGPAYQLFGDYLNGVANRQDYLETAIKWAADADGVDSVEDYMALHQFDDDAEALQDYFKKVVNWVEATFKVKRKSLMKGQPWGLLYNKYGQTYYDPDEVENKIAALIQDDFEVKRQKGIYEYIFDGDEKHLGLRAFDKKDKLRKYEEQQGVCPHCGKHFEFEEMDGDHILPWSKGGKTEYGNLQMLCIACNRSDK